MKTNPGNSLEVRLNRSGNPIFKLEIKMKSVIESLHKHPSRQATSFFFCNPMLSIKNTSVLEAKSYKIACYRRFAILSKSFSNKTNENLFSST